MRKPGRVLFSPKAIKAILFPLSFSAERRASLRYKIRKSATSAIDDMIFILEHADATTRRHVEKEVGRIAKKTGTTSVSPDTVRDPTDPGQDFAAPAPDADQAETGQEAAEQDDQPAKSKMEREFEDSLWG